MKSKRISASMFGDYQICPHKLYLNNHEHEFTALQISEFSKQQFKKGNEHELIEIKKIPHVEIIGNSLKEKNENTIKELKKGTQTIYQGVLMNSESIGIPDLIQKIENKYQVGDIKRGKFLKKNHINQILLYRSLLKKVVKNVSDTCFIINSKGKRINFNAIEKLEDSKKALSDVKKIINEKKRPGVTITSYCKECVWRQKCVPEAKKIQDVSLIPSFGKGIVFQLRELGVKTLKDFIKTNDEVLETVKGLTIKSIKNHKLQARSILENNPIKKQDFEKLENNFYFFDIESHIELKLDYLFGFLKNDEYIYFLAKKNNETQEKKMWSDFLKWWVKEDKPILIHWGSYERSVIKKLNKKYDDLNENELNELLSNCYDLSVFLKKSYYLPLMDYGLKTVAKWLGFSWSNDDASGAQSIIWYEKYLNGDEDCLKTVLKYNEDDVKATKIIFNWLKKQET